jgi:hypothetical protein
MDGPAEEASIPTEPERLSRILKRKVGKKTCFTLLTEANIKSSPKEDIPARKKPRLQCWIPVGFNFEACQIPDEASLPAIAADADTLNASHNSPDAIVAVASPDAGGTLHVADIPTQPNVEATRPVTRAPPRRWTAEEDTKLTAAVETACKKQWGRKYRTDWDAITALVPGLTKRQCQNRWNNCLGPTSSEPTAYVGKWTAEEDAKLADAAEKHNGEDWEATAALVPGQTIQQCRDRWYNVLLSKNDEETAGRSKLKWTADEDAKLTDAVEKYNGENWAAISALVMGRTRRRCRDRWHNVLLSKKNETTARGGKWTKEEDAKLADAVEKHNGENWAAISSLIPGRTKIQCQGRWQYLKHSKSHDETTACVGTWTKEEDNTLKDAVKKCNGENWVDISSLVVGRTKRQCQSRWQYLKNETTTPADKWTTEEHSTLKDAVKRKGRFTKEEDITLKEAVDKHNCEDWAAISSLVPGRTYKQCWSRWNTALRSKSDETTARKGGRITDEDSTLEDAAEKHNGKDRAAIPELVPGRTKIQWWDRWVKYLTPSRITMTEEEHGPTNEAPALG